VQSQPRLQLRIRSSAKSIAACTCIAEKGAWWAAVWPQLKVRLMCKAGHASNSTPPPQRRKINCTLQTAPAEKAAWGVAR